MPGQERGNVFRWMALCGQMTTGEKAEEDGSKRLEEKMSPLHSPCPHSSHSKQMVHTHRNSSVFLVHWKVPVRSPIQPPLPFHFPADVYVPPTHRAPCGELGIQAKHLPWRVFILVGGDRPSLVTQQLD